MFDMVLHRLDHDNGVIDDQADGKDHPEEGEGVDGKAEQREEREGSHQRHRHRQERDERGPPPLEEDEDHQDDQYQRLEEGMLDLVDPLGDRQGGVQRHRVLKVRRKALASAPPSVSWRRWPIPGRWSPASGRGRSGRRACR